MAIRFYRVKDKYGCFSNFAPYSFRIGNIDWKTSEHYFQAHKFEDEAYFNKVRLSNSPMDAANFGRARNVAIRKDWEEIKDNIMREAVYEKFSQNENIRDVLLSTGDEEIIEETVHDYYWGCGYTGGREKCSR